MPSSSFGHLCGAVLPAISSALFSSMFPGNQGMQNSAVRESPLMAVASSAPVFMPQGPLPAIPRALSVNHKVSQSVVGIVPASALNADHPFDIAVPSAVVQPHGFIFNATGAQEASNFPSFFMAAPSKFVNHLKTYRNVYAIGVPLFFIPVMWTIFCIICAVRKAASAGYKRVGPFLNGMAFYAVEAFTGVSQESFLAAIFQLVRSILLRGSGVGMHDPDLSPFFIGLQSAFRNMLCAMHTAVLLDLFANQSRRSCIGFFLFIGLHGFVRGYGCTTDFATTHSSPPRNGRTGVRWSGNTPSNVNSTTLEGVGYLDWSEYESDDEKAQARWSELRTKAFRFAAQSSRGRNSRTRRSSRTTTEAPVISYDGDTESDDDISIVRTERTTPVFEHKASRTKGTSRSASKKAKGDRPAVHPSVKDILGPKLYEKMNRPKNGQGIKAALVMRQNTEHLAGPNKLASVETTPATKATSDAPTIPTTPIASYLLPPTETPKHSRFSSTPKESQKTHNPKTSPPPSPSVWSPTDIPSIPDVDHDFGIGGEPIPSILVSPAPPTTETPEPLATSASIEDALNATFDLSREWRSYGGDDEFVRRVETKAAAGSTIEETMKKGVHEMKLILGTGLFLNEDGVETVCSRVLRQSRSAVLDKLDAILAKHK